MKYTDATPGTKVVYRPNPGGPYFTGEVMLRPEGSTAIVLNLGPYGTVRVRNEDLDSVDLDRLIP